MKKLLLALCISAGTLSGYAQKTVKNENPLKYFTEGKEMFIDKNYTGSIHSLNEFKKYSTDEKLNVEADYMLVSCLYLQGSPKAETKLREFAEAHPETYHANQINFYIGSICFDKKDWQQALYWLDQTDVNYLSPGEQEDYAYRMAYTGLQSNRRDNSKHLFKALTHNSKKYADPANYYLAYIDFQDGEYDKALPVLEKLKNRSEYREEASFLLTQAHFLRNDLNKTIEEGETYISNYPRNKNTGEVYRMLGNSYNRKYDLNSSIQKYERYMSLESSPMREDMYLLGSSYYQIGNYQKSVDALKLVASTNDLLGQAAYMELGQAYLKLTDNQNALMAFEAASRVNFDPATREAALFNYALLTHQTSVSIFGESITVFQRFLKEYPQSKYRNQIYDILASSFLSTKDYTAALNAINEIQSPGQQILEAKQLILFRLGTQDFINNNYQAANNNFNASINMGNYSPKARNESHFWRAEIAYRQGNFQAAARDYQTYVSNAHSTDVNYAIAYYNLGYSHFQMKQYTGALNSFLKYVGNETMRSNATYADALNRIGDCYLYNRNFSSAEKYYAQAATANPKDADYADFQNAFVMGLQRNYAGKISALDRMMTKYPNSQYQDDALFEKSKALVMMRREGEAIRAIEKLTAEYPQSPFVAEAGVQLGQLYFNANNPNKSIEAYKRVISNFPNSEESRISIKSLESVYRDINDIPGYASYVNSLGTGIVITASRQDSLSFLAAESIYMKDSKPKARTAMANYLQSYPNGTFSSDAHYYLGVIAFEGGNKESALEDFNYVIRSNNRKYLDDALIYVSGIEFDRKNYTAAYEAYSHLGKVASNADNKNVAQLGMLRSASQMNRDNEVISAASELLNNQKTSPDIAIEALYYRAKSRINTSQTEAALSDLQLLARDTRNVFGAEAQYLLANSYYSNKQYDKTIEQVMGFVKQGTPHEYWMAKAIIVLADSYRAKGEDFQANQYLENLNANYKGSEADIKEALKERLNN
ncbi:outer membrane protein assembly factor BamD [Dysgonomonas sp. 216]|uniref:tetratricopeptide repeat protein n=1 Tax=Dysgonomonas sp. 216 TaxID=2302934 RepID=UPI0013D6FC3B|nr:tetratricopeptide repeat protein [Dysgonomonas sp. 216]NDW17361.1 outer membrane protein assembly factor BamD [Dysgonomonas sp. 216]